MARMTVVLMRWKLEEYICTLYILRADIYTKQNSDLAGRLCARSTVHCYTLIQLPTFKPMLWLSLIPKKKFQTTYMYSIFLWDEDMKAFLSAKFIESSANVDYSLQRRHRLTAVTCCKSLSMLLRHCLYRSWRQLRLRARVYSQCRFSLLYFWRSHRGTCRSQWELSSDACTMDCQWELSALSVTATHVGAGVNSGVTGHVLSREGFCGHQLDTRFL